MLRGIFLIGTTAFWLTMTTLLIRREFFQLMPIQRPYEILPLHSDWLRQEYQAYYLGEQRVGFGFTVLEALKEGEEVPADEAYELRHQTYLSFRLLGRDTEFQVKGKARLDPQLSLKSFETNVSSKDYVTRLTGQIANGNLNLVIEGSGIEPARKILPVREPVIFSEALDLIWTPENLRIGKRGVFQIWNPLLADIEELHFEVRHKEILSYEGKESEVYVIVLNRGGIETRIWVNMEGTVLRKESPTGVVMQLEPAWKIFDAMRASRGEPPDLPNLFSVPTNQIIKKPEALESLKIQIKTPEGEKTLEIQKTDLKGLDNIPLPPPLPAGEDFTAFLESTEWIQSKDPQMISKAREIAGMETSALAASLKLIRWVHAFVTPIQTVTLPSALEVLNSKRGDCNEYTALFTALARSLGIPAKMVAGLVYQGNRFFYHAWPEVYLGRWVPLDPTFNQAPADATHIPLVEGSLQEQVGLISKLGRIKIYILEAET